MKNQITGIIVGAILLSGGVAFTDAQINPYVEKPMIYEITGQSVEKDAGQNKIELSKIEPKVTLSKWDGEASLAMKYDGVQAVGDRPFLSNKIQWKDAEKEVQAFPLSAGENMPDGGFEMQVVLHAKPDNFVTEFPLVGWENFDFVYQPPMNERGITDWHGVPVTCTETECADAEGNVLTFIPENAVGSYEVRHKVLKEHMVNADGSSAGVNYETGIFGQVFRPQLTDANGKKFWGTLKYVPGKFLVDSSKLQNDDTINWSKFTIDPTFGYTTLGTAIDATDKFANANIYTASAACTPVTAYYGGYMTSGTGTVYVSIYDGEATLSGNTRLDTSSGITLTANGTTGSFQSAAITGTALVNATAYWIETYSNTVGVRTKYSATGGVTDSYTNTNVTPTPPSTHAATGGTVPNTQISVYVDCAAAADTTLPQHKMILNNAKGFINNVKMVLP